MMVDCELYFFQVSLRGSTALTLLNVTSHTLSQSNGNSTRTSSSPRKNNDKKKGTERC